MLGKSLGGSLDAILETVRRSPAPGGAVEFFEIDQPNVRKAADIGIDIARHTQIDQYGSE